jgi:hypothetical protein
MRWATLWANFSPTHPVALRLREECFQREAPFDKVSQNAKKCIRDTDDN